MGSLVGRPALPCPSALLGLLELRGFAASTGLRPVPRVARRAVPRLWRALERAFVIEPAGLAQMVCALGLVSIAAVAIAAARPVRLPSNHARSWCRRGLCGGALLLRPKIFYAIFCCVASRRFPGSAGWLDSSPTCSVTV